MLVRAHDPTGVGNPLVSPSGESAIGANLDRALSGLTELDPKSVITDRYCFLQVLFGDDYRTIMQLENHSTSLGGGHALSAPAYV